MSKRLFDLAWVALGLATLWPLMLAVAVAVKLDSRGPVLFRQVRVGRFGKEFRIHKFRTMRQTSQAARETLPLVSTDDDPRITRVGRWLRRSKLDEMPQLIDVLRGDMSIVGPRPEVPRYVAFYPEALRRKILSVRPGITDLASLAYRDESRHLSQAANPEQAYIDIVLPAKLRLAAQYVDTASLWLDVRLILRTLRIMGRR